VARYVEELPTLKEPERPRPAEPIGEAPLEVPPRGPRPLGRYALLFEIARGGMGSVHAAVLRGEGGVERPVAIKLLHPQDRGPEEIDAFIQEAKLTAHIAHPNVLETFELGMQDGEPFIVMPLVRGVTLARLMTMVARRRERTRPELAAWIAMKVASALHAAHELVGPDGAPLHLVHRDVSPQNVMLAFDGEVLLVDFGIAKLFESARATASGIVKGKFGYMSPEQLLGEPLDRRTDVFALGVVLYEMLSGRGLYAGLAPAAAALRITTESPPPLSESAPGTPASLCAIVEKAMAKAREARHATAKELEGELRRFLRDGAGADEAELTRLLDEHFGDERAAFDRRLREALEAARRAPHRDAPATIPARDADRPPRSRRSRGALALAIATAGVGVGAALFVTLGRTSPRAAASIEEADAALSVASAVPATSGSSPPPPARSAAAPSASGDASSSAASGAPSASMPLPRTRGARPARPAAEGGPPEPSSPAAAATLTAAPPSATVKGEPFRRW